MKPLTTTSEGAEVGAAQARGLISDVFGCLKREGEPVLSIDEITRLAAQGWACESERGASGD